MQHFSFFKNNYKVQALRNFWELDEHSIPESPGSYIILTRSGKSFNYPVKKSPIFYIGKAVNLSNRLHQHLRYARQAKYDRKLVLYWPLYEWLAVIGGRYTFIKCNSNNMAKRLEQNLLAQFAKKHRCWPLANGQGGWDSLS